MQVLTHHDRRRRRQEIAEYVQGGMTVEAAARKFQVTASTIESACRENGVPFTRFVPDNHDKILRIIAKLCAGRGTIAEVGREAYVAREYVRQVAKGCIRWDVPIHKRYK